MIKVWPVIHLRDLRELIHNVNIADKCGVDGVLLISHEGDADATDSLGKHVATIFPSLRVGANYLSESPGDAIIRSIRAGFSALWSDNGDVSAGRAGAEATSAAMIKRPGDLYFCGFDFKYQTADPTPGATAREIIKLGFIPTTSGPATGVAPDVAKLAAIRAELQSSDALAVASGLTPENVRQYDGLITHALVSTGISRGFYTFDQDRLSRFMEASQ